MVKTGIQQVVVIVKILHIITNKSWLLWTLIKTLSRRRTKVNVPTFCFFLIPVMSQSRRTGSLALPYKQTATLTGHSSAVLVVKLNRKFGLCYDQTFMARSQEVCYFNVADGQYCLSGSQDKSIKLWNPWKGTLIKTYMGHGWEVLDIDMYVLVVHSLATSREMNDEQRYLAPMIIHNLHRWEGIDPSTCGTFLVVQCCENFLVIIIVSMPWRLVKMPMSLPLVRQITIRMELTMLNSHHASFLGSYDSTVRLWDLRSSSRFPIQILEEAKDSISSLEIHSTEILAG